MIHGKNILLLLLPSKALLCEAHTGIIRGRCQPRILVFTRMQIRFLWFCRYVVLDMALVLPRERGQGMTLLYVTSS